MDDQFIEILDKPVELRRDSIAAGTFHESFKSKVPLECAEGTVYAVGFTMPTIASLCHKGLEWEEYIMNTCAALLFKRINILTIKLRPDTAVLPFIFNPDMDYKDVLLKYTQSKEKLCMICGKDNRHWMFVEILKQKKLINIHGRVKNESSTKFFNYDNEDELMKTTAALFKCLLEQLGWIGGQEDVFSTDVKEDQTLWRFSFEEVGLDAQADTECCGPRAFLKMHAYLLGDDKTWSLRLHATCPQRTRACILLCKALNHFWNETIWDNDSRILKAFSKSTFEFFKGSANTFKGSTENSCFCSKWFSSDVLLFCLRCCKSFHFECWLADFKNEIGTKGFGQDYVCRRCSHSLQKLVVIHTEDTPKLIGMLTFPLVHEDKGLSEPEELDRQVKVHAACLKICKISGFPEKYIPKLPKTTLDKIGCSATSEAVVKHLKCAKSASSLPVETILDKLDSGYVKASDLMIHFYPWFSGRHQKDLPKSWLQGYLVGLLSSKKNDFNVIHVLYGSILCLEDFEGIEDGDTIAILTPDQKLAVAAITYLRTGHDVFINFFAVKKVFCSRGLGSFLLCLLQAIVVRQCGKFSCYLSAERNSYFKRWCTSQGFKRLSDPVSLGSIHKVANMKKIVSLELKTARNTSGIYKRFFHDPLSRNFHDLSIYASFPGKITFRQSQNCMDDQGVFGDDNFVDESAMYSDAIVVLPQGVTPVCVTWLTRCMAKSGESLADEIFVLILAWLQRHEGATAWSKITVVEPAIINNLSSMKDLYDRNCNAEHFHPSIDQNFMNHAEPVMTFILNNKKLLEKRFIAFLPSDGYQMAAFITIKKHEFSKKRGSNESKFDYFEVGKVKVDPLPVCIFFLNLASVVFGSNESTMPCFLGIKTFHNFLNAKGKKPWSQFNKLLLPEKFNDIKNIEDAESSLFSFTFLLEFCKMVAIGNDYLFNVDSMNCPTRDRVAKVNAAVIQTLDRIAETQDPGRKDAAEYKDYIKKLAERTDVVPSKEERYADFVGRGWKPLGDNLDKAEFKSDEGEAKQNQHGVAALTSFKEVTPPEPTTQPRRSPRSSRKDKGVPETSPSPLIKANHVRQTKKVSPPDHAAESRKSPQTNKKDKGVPEMSPSQPIKAKKGATRVSPQTSKQIEHGVPKSSFKTVTTPHQPTAESLPSNTTRWSRKTCKENQLEVKFPQPSAQSKAKNVSRNMESSQWPGHARSKSETSSLPSVSALSFIDPSDETCKFKFDEKSRILRVTVTSEIGLSQEAKTALFKLMELDDIAIITQGLCNPLDINLWNDKCIVGTCSEMTHFNFRQFRKHRKGQAYAELKTVSMKVNDYFEYLTSRKHHISALQAMKCTSIEGNPIEINHDDVIYMLDYDIKKMLPLHYANFKQAFLLPEILPGGMMCALNFVNEASRPDLGPNLYITPPGSFTRFHKDGFGAVDSGHLCLSGFNEVVIFRRLPEEFQFDNYDALPHSPDVSSLVDALTFPISAQPLLVQQVLSAFEWPTKDQITQWTNSNYCPIVLTLEPGEHLHIGKQRYHAFRKLCAMTLPENDCHSDLRRVIHERLKSENFDFDSAVNISLAWDWNFLGVSVEGINCEMTLSLNAASKAASHNREGTNLKESLAIPKLCVIAASNAALAANNANRLSFGINTSSKSSSQEHYCNVIKGLHSSLKRVVDEENQFHKLLQELKDEGASLEFAQQPNSSEDPCAFPLDPFAYADYQCKICFQELSNTYLHCVGCEIFLQKDFNICCTCFSKASHCKFFQMGKTNDVDSSLNHTGEFPGVCDNHSSCSKCDRCRKCACTCHQEFIAYQRFWHIAQLNAILENASEFVKSTVACQSTAQESSKPEASSTQFVESAVACQLTTLESSKPGGSSLQFVESHLACQPRTQEPSKPEVSSTQIIEDLTLSGHIVPFVSQYQTAIDSEQRKIEWRIFQDCFQSSRLPREACKTVQECLSIIQEGLQKERNEEVVTDIKDKDIIFGRKVEMSRTANIHFSSMIAKFADQYHTAQVKKRTNVVEALINSLRTDGYRFLHKRDGIITQMSHKKTVDKIIGRFYEFARQKLKKTDEGVKSESSTIENPVEESKKIFLQNGKLQLPKEFDHMMDLNSEEKPGKIASEITSKLKSQGYQFIVKETKVEIEEDVILKRIGNMVRLRKFRKRKNEEDNGMSNKRKKMD